VYSIAASFRVGVGGGAPYAAVVGLRSWFLAHRQRDRERTAEAYRASPFRTWAVRAVAIVAVSAVAGAFFFPLWGTSTRADGAYFGAVLQLGVQVMWRLLGRREARREAGL
jgi:uncharacterized membrane protein